MCLWRVSLSLIQLVLSRFCCTSHYLGSPARWVPGLRISGLHMGKGGGFPILSDGGLFPSLLHWATCWFASLEWVNKHRHFSLASVACPCWSCVGHFDTPTLVEHVLNTCLDSKCVRNARILVK